MTTDQGRPPLRDRAPRLLALAILAMGFVACVAINWPGHLEYDSIVQLLQGRTGVYSSWHPPVMAWLLGLYDRMLPGAALFVVQNAALAFGAFAVIFALPRRTSWVAVPFALILVALPQLILFQAIVLKDVLFADSVVAGFVAIAAAGTCWERPVRRNALLATALVLISLAVLTRQNGLLILPFAFAAVGYIGAREQPRTALRIALVFAAACAAFELSATAALNTRVTARPSQTEIRIKAQIYDMVGMLKADPGLKLPILDAKAPRLEALMRTGGVARYTPASIDPVAAWNELGYAGLAAPGPVADQWVSLILNHPMAYLAVRARLFAWLTLSQHPNQCASYAVGVDGPPEKMKALGVTFRDDERDDRMDDYAGSFVGWGLFHPSFYVLGLACAVFLLRRRTNEDLAMLALMGASVLYAASYFVISVACEYRYLYVVDLAALAAAAHIAASWRERPGRRRPIR